MASGSVSALAGSTMQTFTTVKLKIIVSVLALGALVGGIGFALRPAAAEGNPPAASPLPLGAVARLGDERFGHQGPVFFVGFARKGQLVTAQQGFTAYCATCHQDPLDNRGRRPLLDDRAFQVWDLEAGRAVRRFGRPEQADDGCTVRGVRLAAGSSRPAAVYVTLSANGQTIAVAGTDGFVRLWDVAAGREVQSLAVGPNARAVALAFTPDGNQLAVYDTHGMVRLWDAGAGREIRQFRVADPNRTDLRWGEALVFSPGGNTLAVSAGVDFRLWDTTTGKERVRIIGKVPGCPAAAFTPDGTRLLFASDGVVRLADASTGTLMGSFGDGSQTAYLAALAVAPDGKTVATRGYDQSVRLWDLQSGRQLRLLNPSRLGIRARDGTTLFGSTYVSPASSLAFSPDGRSLAAADASGGARLWEVATGEEIHAGHAGPVTDVDFTTGGSALVSVGADHTLRKWRADTGAEIACFRLPPGAPDVALSPDGRLAAFSVAAGQVQLWDVDAGQALRQFDVPAEDAFCVGSIGADSLAFSPDGKLLAKRARRGVVHLWEVASGRQRAVLTPEKDPEVISAPAGNRRVRFSHDGSLLAVLLPYSRRSNTANGVAVWSLASGKRTCRIDCATAVTTPPAFSPDGRTLALGHDGGSISLWEVCSGQHRCTLASAENRDLRRVAFAPDGKVLAGADRRTVRFWDLLTGKELASRQGHSLDLVSVAFAPDGRRLVSGSHDATALVWDVVGLRPEPRTVRLEERDWPALWSDLAGSAPAGFVVMRRLEKAGPQAVRLLRKHLRPKAAPEPARVSRLLADLGSAEFAVRTKATEKLAELGDLALPALRQALAAGAPPESRRRLQELIEALISGPSPQKLREMRAVELLEHCGTAEARALLKELAGGAPEASLSREAAAALRRLDSGQP
jgi:WD40 repeat protein